MFRYLLWRLRFEWCNLKRLCGHGPERVEYLAFGANLSDDIMRKRRITPFASRPFTLRDHGLRFDHPAPWHNCGYASAEPAPGECVYGYLYTLSARDAARMDFYEVVPVLKRYRRTVVVQDGVELFFYQTNRSTPSLKPTDEYLGYIVNGLADHPDVEDSYREAIAANGTAEPGALVATYFRPDSEGPNGPLRGIVDAYSRASLAAFMAVIYPFSPTALFIRVKASDD